LEQSGSDCYIKDASGNYLLNLQNTSKDDITSSHFTTTTYLDNSLAVIKNSAPVIFNDNAFNVFEGSTNVGAISVEDKDEDTLVYSIASGYNGNRFSIDSGTGYLTLKATSTIDETLYVNVSASDGLSSVTKLITVNHYQTNDAPTLTVPSNSALTEDDSTTSVSGTLSGSDPESDTLSFIAVGSTASSGVYTVKGSYGTITLNASTGAYTYTIDNTLSQVQALGSSQSLTDSFSVQLSDGTNTTAAQALSFTINGANDAPTDIQLTSTAVIENSLGATVGSLTASDVDTSSLTFTVSSDDDG
jgi:VCBS repeat-containing protein